MDNFFQCCIILLKLKHWKKQWTNFWEYIFTFLTEKNCVLVFIILINWTELAFTSYENKKQKKTSLIEEIEVTFCYAMTKRFFTFNYLIAVFYGGIFKKTILNKTISEVWPKLRSFLGVYKCCFSKYVFFDFARQPWKVCAPVGIKVRLQPVGVQLYYTGSTLNVILNNYDQKQAPKSSWTSHFCTSPLSGCFRYKAFLCTQNELIQV